MNTHKHRNTISTMFLENGGAAIAALAVSILEYVLGIKCWPVVFPRQCGHLICAFEVTIHTTRIGPDLVGGLRCSGDSREQRLDRLSCHSGLV